MCLCVCSFECRRQRRKRLANQDNSATPVLEKSATTFAWLDKRSPRALADPVEREFYASSLRSLLLRLQLAYIKITRLFGDRIQSINGSAACSLVISCVARTARCVGWLAGWLAWRPSNPCASSFVLTEGQQRRSWRRRRRSRRDNSDGQGKTCWRVANSLFKRQWWWW